MGLFKSKKERDFEKNLEIKKGFTKFRREITALEKNEKDWIDKYKRAKKLNNKDNMAFIKANLRRTLSLRKSLESQLLMLESAVQMKNQMEAFSQFSRSILAVSDAISQSYADTDIAKVQKNFEKAMAQAESMSEMMDLFLDMSQNTVITDAGNLDNVSDEDVDSLLEEIDEEKDKDLMKDLKEMENELDN